MDALKINQKKVTEANAQELVNICPFNAIEYHEGKMDINAACKMCKICVKKGPQGVIELVKTKDKKIDKSKWRGIAVYVDHHKGNIHPVTFELIGKALELAEKVKYEVYCVFLGHNIKEKAKELLYYGVDKVFVCDYKELEHFKIEPYTSAFENFIKKTKPSIILVGATTVGRSLAPRIAARFKTGLTADCTVLDIKKNTDLVQIRPAFGGNIMAQIITPNCRPQLATVRYKIMDAPKKLDKPTGKIVDCKIDISKFSSDIEVLKVTPKGIEENICDAEMIVVAGRFIKTQKDLQLAEELAEVLEAQFAGTRPLVESGWIEAKKQIGLSGRTVKPKLIITLGVSGAVQFTAGMNSSDYIFAINKDPKASIFSIAHYGIVGDIFEVVPKLIALIKKDKGKDKAGALAKAASKL